MAYLHSHALTEEVVLEMSVLSSCYGADLNLINSFYIRFVCFPSTEAAPQFPWKLNFSFQSLDLNLHNLNVSNSTLSFNKYDRDFDHKSLTLTFTLKLILALTVSMVMTLTVTLLLRLIQILNLIQIQS